MRLFLSDEAVLGIRGLKDKLLFCVVSFPFVVIFFQVNRELVAVFQASSNTAGLMLAFVAFEKGMLYVPVPLS